MAWLPFTTNNLSEEDLIGLHPGRLVFWGNDEQSSELGTAEHMPHQTWSHFNGISELDNHIEPVSRQLDDDGDQPLTTSEEMFADNQNVDDDVPLIECLQSIESTDPSERHCHAHNQSHDLVASRKARNQLIISSFLCLTFMLVEIIGGHIANSLAIMTDAAHLLSDLASFMVNLLAIWLAKQPPTRKMSFGCHRAEILGAVLSMIIIWIITGVLLYFAILRLIHQDFIINADMMIIVSGSGVAMNIIMGVVLHGMCDCHGHSHGNHHQHNHSIRHDSENSRRSKNINIRAAMIHIIGDLVQSLGVLVAAYIIKYKPNLKLLDPISTFIFSVIVFLTTCGIMRDAIRVLMEGFPPEVDYAAIKQDLQNISGVVSVHNLHVWSLTTNRNVLAVHLAIDETTTSQKTLQVANAIVRRKYPVHFSAIQIEPYLPSIMVSCQQCRDPVS